jgi:hypothetical protein
MTPWESISQDYLEENHPEMLVRPTNLPTTTARGELIVNAGRYARNAVLTVYEQIGGNEAMAAWAKENRGEFYTKLFSRTIQRDVEVQASESIEQLLEQLDRPVELVGEFREVDDGVG